MLLRDCLNPSWRNPNDRIEEVHDMATFKQFLLLSISVLKAAMCFFTFCFFFVVDLSSKRIKINFCMSSIIHFYVAFFRYADVQEAIMKMFIVNLNV